MWTDLALLGTVICLFCCSPEGPSGALCELVCDVWSRSLVRLFQGKVPWFLVGFTAVLGTSSLTSQRHGVSLKIVP